MKLAWLCWETPDDTYPVVKFAEPDRPLWRVIPIVYAEIQPQEEGATP